MFAHQVIEDLRNSLKEFNFPKDYADAIMSYSGAIKNSHCFHLGNADDALAIINNRNKNYGIFVDNAEYIKLPYDFCWFDAIKTNNSDYSKMGVLLFNHPLIIEVIGVSLYAFFKKYNSWTLLPMCYFFKVGKSFFPEELKKLLPNASSYDIKSSDGEIHNVCAQILDKNYPVNDYEPMNNICRRFLTIVENSILLLNCKNVITKDNYPDVKLNNSRKKRNKQPLFSYKTLHLNIPINIKKENNKLSNIISQDHNRIHFCRGHFKSYTNDAPLFGKIVGLWWWQSHVRGQNKDGIVMKDYKISNVT